jgi:hypothetical protein
MAQCLIKQRDNFAFIYLFIYLFIACFCTYKQNKLRGP